MEPFVRSPYNYDLDKASIETACDTKGETLTVQAGIEDADINVMMKRFGVTGHFPESPKTPMYGDFTHITDFKTALEAIQTAMDNFMEFPAELRQRFENNPQRMLEYMEAGGSPEALRELMQAKPPLQPTEPPPVPAAKPKVEEST